MGESQSARERYRGGEKERETKGGRPREKQREKRGTNKLMQAGLSILTEFGLGGWCVLLQRVAAAIAKATQVGGTSQVTRHPGHN